MSRAKIGAAIAVVVVALTAVAYFLTTSSLETRITKDVESRVARAQQLLIQNASLEGLGLIKRAQTFARDPQFVEVLLGDSKGLEKAQAANEAFNRFLGELKEDKKRPDFLAVVDKDGKLAAMQDVPRPAPEDWKSQFPAVAAALERGQIAKDVWAYRNAILEVGVAPVYDPETADVIGAVVIAYAINAEEAHQQSELLGMQVAYFTRGRVFATSFRRNGAEEDVEKQNELGKPLFKEGLAKRALGSGQPAKVTETGLGDSRYVMTAAKLPLNYSDDSTGAAVLMSLSDALKPVDSVRVSLLLLGLGALLVALLAMVVTSRTILAPAEEIELGVTEIINGNTEYVFKPVGADFDGLANALNVMLARLLGRPEPGEEEFDEEGNLQNNAMILDEGELAGAKVATDAETLSLAQEPEADYYRRVYSEYIDARKNAGLAVDGVNFEGFVAKLRLTEANLKKKYNCRAVRFRVKVAGKQVTLKPVPIV